MEGSRPQTSRIPDIATQTPLCTALHAQVDPCFDSLLMLPQTPLSMASVLPATQTPLCTAFSTPDTSLCSGSRPQTSRIPDIATQTPLCTALSAQTSNSTATQTPLCTAFPAQTSLAARPNSYLPYPLLSNEHLPTSAANVLNTQGIAELLRNYPNQRFVDTLVSIAISGVQVGYTGSLSGQTRRQNHASAFAHPNVIADSIQSDISKGRVKEIATNQRSQFLTLILHSFTHRP